MEFTGAENILDTLDIYVIQIEIFSLSDLLPSSLHILYVQLEII